MKAVLQVYDQSVSGALEPRRTLSFGSDWVTGADLIRRRIEDELAECWHQISPRQDLAHIAAGKGWLVKPHCEQDYSTPNLVINRQLADAFSAFQNDLFRIIVDNESVTDLDRPLNLRPDSTVIFIHLRPPAKSDQGL